MALVKADELFNRGMQIIKGGGDLNEAEKIFNILIDEDIDSDVTIYALGCCAIGKGRFGLAINLFKQAVSQNPNFAEAWNNMGCCYRTLCITDKALESFKKADELKKDEPDFLGNIGGCHVASGDPKKALHYLNKCLEKVPSHASALNNKSLAYLEQGNWQAGFALYDYRMEATGNHEERDYHANGTPYWEGESNKTVVVYGEQGIGDEIMFASVLPDIMNECNVILDAHPRLADIFRNSFTDIPIYGTRKSGDLMWPAMYKIDAKISIGSLARFYRFADRDFPRIPYLSPEASLKQLFKERLLKLGSKPKIGISWKGGTKKTNKKYRTIPLKQWMPIFEGVEADFISLQYQDDAEIDIENFEKVSKIKIHHWRDVIDDYDQTAGLVANLDLVISVPQSVVHLAGALGTACWQLTPFRAMWQMGPYGKDMPWYDSVKSYWQGSDCLWPPVIGRVLSDLKQSSLPKDSSVQGEEGEMEELKVIAA